MDFFLPFLIAGISEKETHRSSELADIKINRKILRDKCNPLELPENMFIKQFRLNKAAFLFVLNIVQPKIPSSSGIQPILKLAVCLRFFAEGGYQRGVGNDANISMDRSTVSKALSEVLDILEEHLCPEWISLQMTEAEIDRQKLNFFRKFGFPGVVGCIDGTHIRIIKPKLNPDLYYNRKGYYSLNALIVCDSDMYIRSVEAKHPGRSHDSAVWATSEAKVLFEQAYSSGERDRWMLADAGYPLEPYMMTPYRMALPGTAESKYNTVHARARNIVERTIGVLKNRFRCTIGAREMHYAPTKAIQIINVCAALHNICTKYRIEEVITGAPIPNFESIPCDDSMTPSAARDEANIIRNDIRDNL